MYAFQNVLSKERNDLVVLILCEELHVSLVIYCCAQMIPLFMKIRNFSIQNVL